MIVERLGDCGFILSDLGARPYLVAEAIWRVRPEWLVDCYASYETVGLFFNAGELDLEVLERFLDTLAVPEQGECRTHTVPVCYEMGEDVEEACNLLSMSIDELAAAHCSNSYACFAIGFTPGFPYLGYLPDGLRGIPRRAQPRVRVEPRSVAISGKQTGIYPMATPGGWAIIGRTPIEMVNVKDGYFPISAGDEVQFARIDQAEFKKLQGSRL